LLSGQRPDQYGASKVSIGRNYMEGSSDRSPNNAGYQEVQFYNNIVINCGWGAFAQVTVEGSQSPTMLAESNVFINNPNGNLRAWKTTNGNITADAYVNTDDGQGAFGNRNTGGDPINVDTPVPSNIPMSPSATTKMPVADVEAYVTANAGACNGDIDNEISPPTGCPTEVVTDGNISIEEPLPAGGSYWLSSSPFWSCTQNGNNFDKTPYVSAANPYAFTLVGLPAGEYCCNFEGTPMDANGNQLATLYNQCCFTVVSSQANEIIDSGCPVTEISVGTSVNLLLGQTGVPANASNITYSANVSPGSSGNVNVAGNNYNFTPQQQGNYSITVERCYDTGTPSTDLRTRLLASPNRTGYGGNATGGTNYVYVKNFQELNAALQVDDNYVVIDPSLANTAMGFPTEVYVNANNITLDGSEAPGFSMYPDYAAGYPPNLPMMNNFSIGGNKIFHNLKFDGRRIFPYQNSGNSFNVGALFFRKGKDIWVDHVEITGFWDDAILLGMPQSNSADYITLSWLKIHNTDKGVTFYNSAAINEGDGHLSIFNSEFNAAGRNPKNGGGEFVHQWNNYYHDWAWAADMAGAGSTSNSTGKIAPARTYSENNFYENGEDGAAQYSNTNSSSTAHPGIYYDNGGSQFSDVQYQTTGNHQIVSSAPWSIPYSYQVIPANQIKSKVLEGAGATVNYSQNGGVTTICQTEFCEFTVTGENPDNSATIYEAEAATLVGVTKANSNYTGISNGEYVTGFDNDGDKIIFNNINAPSSGTYSLTIRYACSSYKENYVSVNGGGNQNIAFSPSSTFTNKTMNINLNEGNNSISIEKHWGWFDLDYIKIDVIGNPEPPQPNTTLRFEAENGMPVGVNNESDPSASNGEYVTGFDGDEDKITVTAQVENAGMYQLKIGYRSTSGDKKNDLYLNGMFLGNIQFLQSNTFTEMGWM